MPEKETEKKLVILNRVPGVLFHPREGPGVQGAVVLDYGVRGIEPRAVDLVDLLLGESRLLGQAVVVLLHPAVDDALPPQVAQDEVRQRRALVLGVGFRRSGAAPRRLAHHAGADSGAGVEH